MIQSFRYILGIEPVGAAAKKDHQAIVKEVLGSGATVRVVVDTVAPTPGTFTIERTAPEPRRCARLQRRGDPAEAG